VAGDAADHPPARRWSGHHRRTISRSRAQHFDGWIELAERDDQAEGAIVRWLAHREITREQLRDLILRALEGTIAAAQAVDDTIASP